MNTGGQAFPSVVGGGGKDHGGMSLRDYFAGQALVGTLARPLGDGESINTKVAAEFSYKMADAMLVAREAK